MRALLVLALFLIPSVAAEFGAYDSAGWPIAADGTSTNPYGTGIGAMAPETFSAEPLNHVAGTTVYPYYPILLAEVQRLAESPLVTLHSAGRSTAGLDLWMLEIANHDAIAAGEGVALEDREVIWVDGGTHSNEYSGVYFTLAVAQFLVDAYGENETATWIVDNRHTWIMPLVNPDGSHAFGRLNANGVNINRNYPVVWDGQGNDPLMNNRGPSPASEVETQANIAWFEKVMPDYYASIHCCGNLWLYPYGEEGVDPVDQDMLQKVCDEAFADVRDDCGPIWSTIYPASGSSVDTAYEVTGAVSFGYEMSGRGAISLWGQPVTFDEVFDQERESWAGLLHAFQNVERYGALLDVATEAVSEGTLVTLTNNGMGLSNSTVIVVDGTPHHVGPIPAGESVQVSVPRGDIVVEYEKRLMASPTRLVEVPLAEVAVLDQAANVPFVGVALVVGLLAAAALRRP